MRSTHTTYHSLVDTFIAFGDEYTLRRNCAIFTNWNKEWQKNYTHVKIIDCVCVCVCDQRCKLNWRQGWLQRVFSTEPHQVYVPRASRCMKIVETNPIIFFFYFINLVFLPPTPPPPLVLTPWGIMFAEESLFLSLSLVSLLWIRGHGGLQHAVHVRMSSKMPFTFRDDDQTLFIVTAARDIVSFISDVT